MKNESEVAQSCPTLSDPMDCSLLGSSIHGIFQARVLECGATAFSAKAGDPGSTPRSGGSPREGNGNPLQYSCLENPKDRGAWGVTVCGITKSWARLSDSTHACTTLTEHLCARHQIMLELRKSLETNNNQSFSHCSTFRYSLAQQLTDSEEDNFRGKGTYELL